MPDIKDMLKNSVTSGETSIIRNGAVLNMMVPLISPAYRMVLPPQLPPYWSTNRDWVLKSTVFQEAMWAAAVGIAITKIASLSWEVTGESVRKITDTRELFIKADGRKVGWVNFLSKHLRDYLSTDNGAFVEIVRASRSIGSKVVGLKHLDSMRCTRTGDPDIPVLYRDRVGRIHEMKDHQIMMFSEMPEPSETYFGVGLCAASRAYNAIYKLSVMEQYLREKVGGLRPLAIYIVNGVLDGQLKDSIETARSEQISRGVAGYMGAVVIGVPSDIPPQLVTIPLAELPDNFNRKEEFDIAVLTYADNLGLDVQDLQPLSGQSLGSGAQSAVLHDKAQGKGLVAWRQSFIHNINEYVTPDQTSFVFIERDYRDIRQKEEISAMRVNTAAGRISAQITTAEQEFELLRADDELPKELEYIKPEEEPQAGEDAQPQGENQKIETDESISDDEKVEDVSEKGLLDMPITRDNIDLAGYILRDSADLAEEMLAIMREEVTS